MSLHELFLAEVRKHAPTKPDIITHIIDSFIIQVVSRISIQYEIDLQESLEPFPFDSYGCIESLVPSEAISSLWCGSSSIKRSPSPTMTPTPPIKRAKIQRSLF